jgi:hypothetical protein
MSSVTTSSATIISSSVSKRRPALLFGTFVATTIIALIISEVGGSNSKINMTLLPPLSLSIEEALEYLQHASNKQLEERY